MFIIYILSIFIDFKLINIFILRFKAQILFKKKFKTILDSCLFINLLCYTFLVLILFIIIEELLHWSYTLRLASLFLFS